MVTSFSLCLLLVTYVAGFEPVPFVNQRIRFVLNDQHHFQIQKKAGDEFRTQVQGKFLSSSLDTQYEECTDDRDSLCLKWSTDSTVLKVRPKYDSCLDIEVSSEGTWFTCFEYGSDQWYGGPERRVQNWPIQTNVVKLEPYVTTSNENQAVTEPYWFNSKGFSIYVYPDVPLFTDSNNVEENSLCFTANDTAPYNKRENVTLKYEICAFSTPREAHEAAVRNHLGKPTGRPDSRMISQPIWSTWAEYKKDINDEKVREFAQNIVDNGFNKSSQIELDDLWETCYGSLEFDKQKFPDMLQLSQHIKDLGFRLTLWVHPFINTDCEPIYTTAINEGRFVESSTHSYLTSWWDGRASHIDVTNTTTRDWWRARLRKMMEDNGIDSLKIDAGETSWLPQLPILNIDETLYPEQFVQHYVDTVTEFGSFIEVRVAKQTQSRPVFVRMLDKDSHWGIDNGIKSLVTTLFQMSLSGYPFILPDMIGGNAYGSQSVSKELFIRWLQANALMPSMQFSVPPWKFDEETVEITRKFVTLHEEYSPLIIELANRAVTDGTPINTPIWWVDPKDEESLKCRDEYMLGERVLVAPVLEPDARTRDIYLPIGAWQDMTRGEINTTLINGRTWLKDYPVGLDELPIFYNWLANGNGKTHVVASFFTLLLSLLITTVNIW